MENEETKDWVGGNNDVERAAFLSRGEVRRLPVHVKPFVGSGWQVSEPLSGGGEAGKGWGLDSGLD